MMTFRIPDHDFEFVLRTLIKIGCSVADGDDRQHRVEGGLLGTSEPIFFFDLGNDFGS